MEGHSLAIDPNMSVIEIRNTETPELLATRERLSAVFAETYGAKKGDEIEVQIRRVIEDSVRRVSSSRAVFRDRDVVNAALRLVTKPGEFPEKVLEHPMFRRLIEQTAAEYPLVSIGATGTFSTQFMVEAEQKMLALADYKSKQHILPEKAVRAAIQTKRGISEEQIAAAIAACRSEEDLTSIEGTAGAGKTFTVEAICTAYESCGYEIMGAAIAWVAATVLGSDAKIKNSKALTGLLNDMETSAKKPNSEYFNGPTLLVVDEAGMVGTEQMAKLLGYCHASRYPVKVVLTGDSLQVMPISAGAAMETIVAYNKSTRINTIRRQVLESHRTAVYRLSHREAGAALNIFVQQEAVRWAKDEDDQVDMVVRDFLSYRLSNPEGTALALATTNQAVHKINARLRRAYKRLGLIDPEEVEVTVTDGRSRPEAVPFSVGDEIVLRGNNKELPIYEIDPKNNPLDERDWKVTGREGVFNRNTGRIVGIRQAKDPLGTYDFIIDLSGGSTPGRIIVNSETFHKGNREGIHALPMVHNFATTIYGSQGRTVDQVFMLDSSSVDFRYAYVGCSRHRNNLTVYLNETDLHERLDAGHGKRRGPAAIRNPKGVKLKLGRYTRNEMLREVATNWAKDSQNPTAMLYERRERLGINRNDVDLVKLGEVKAPSRSESDNIWDADLRATAFGEVDTTLGMATSWIKNVPLDTDSMIMSAEKMRDLMAWLHVDDLTAECETLVTAMKARRPEGGIWDLAGAEDLAEHMRVVAKQCHDQLETHPSLAQEIYERSQAGDPFSPMMASVVRVLSTRLPKVDIEKILDMEAALEEAPNIRQFEVDINRHALPSVTEIPVDEVSSEPAEASAAPAGLMGRLLAHFSPPAPTAPPTRRFGELHSNLRQPGQPNPFGGTPEPTPVPVPSPKKHGKGLQKVFWRAPLAWLVKAPTPSKAVPWHPVPDPMGKLTPEGSLTFDNVPMTGDPADGGPSSPFLQATYGTWWGRGLLNEPRVFARDQFGVIVSRYSLDGSCVAGDGYPPMLRNPKGDSKTPIYILPGPHEMAWLAEVKFKSANAPGADPSSMPHMVWAAKGADWGVLAKAMVNRPVIIVRSRKDPTQAVWAAALQEELLLRWRLTTKITPALDPVAAPAAPTREMVRPRVRPS